MSTESQMIYCYVTTVLTAIEPPNGAGQFYNLSGKMVITDQTPNPDSKQPYFTITPDNTLRIDVPSGTPLRVQYQVTAPDLPGGPYILNGIYFTESPVEDKTGTKGFPLVTISRETPANTVVTTGKYAFSVQPGTMNVVDSNDYAGYYEYCLVIQDVESGQVGVFDPGYDNEN